MKSIIMMSKSELLALDKLDVNLSKEDLLHIFNVFKGFWSYDRVAAEEGRVGLHAELKSKMCSDGFFYSKTVLQYNNLRRIIAKNLVRIYNDSGLQRPDYVAGIPKGATELGNDVAEILGAKNLNLIKDKQGRIVVMEKRNQASPNGTLLLVEDFTTTGTGFKETVCEIKGRYPAIDILPVELVILNRGAIEYILVKKYGSFNVLALVKHWINSWDPPCELCKIGSKRIKPKVSDENWELLENSQK